MVDAGHCRVVPRNIVHSWLAGVLAAVVATGFLVTTPDAARAAVPVNLGSAANFAVLAGSTVTNTGPTVVTGDLGTSPGAAITGFPPGIVVGAVHAADGIAAAAQTDLTAAYNNAAGQAPNATIATELGGPS